MIRRRCWGDNNGQDLDTLWRELIGAVGVGGRYSPPCVRGKGPRSYHGNESKARCWHTGVCNQISRKVLEKASQGRGCSKQVSVINGNVPTRADSLGGFVRTHRGERAVTGSSS